MKVTFKKIIRKTTDIDFQKIHNCLMELEHFSDWENDFIIDFTEEYGTPIYKVGDFTFTIEYPPYDGDLIIKPAKKVTKTVVQTFWEFDNSIKI